MSAIPPLMIDNSYLSIKVSSNQKDAVYLTDNDSYTCWTPSHRLPHYIRIVSDIPFNEIIMACQPGFNCKVVDVCGKQHIFDENDGMQIVYLDENVSEVKIDIISSWDSYGRICIYNLYVDNKLSN